MSAQINVKTPNFSTPSLFNKIGIATIPNNMGLAEPTRFHIELCFIDNYYTLFVIFDGFVPMNSPLSLPRSDSITIVNMP